MLPVALPASQVMVRLLITPSPGSTNLNTTLVGSDLSMSWSFRSEVISQAAKAVSEVLYNLESLNLTLS